MKKIVERYGSDSELFVYDEEGKRNIQKSKQLASFYSLMKTVFLPQGYPESVSKDYLEYQIWDTLQAFCSSITGMLATRAVLAAYGVGDQSATATAATLTWMMKDGAGMLGRILFAWKKGTQLDCDAKRWRLVADFLNDCAIMFDLVAPLFKSYFIFIACLTGIIRSIVGVAGGATRAALTLHQARRDNMADVSAKDGSQETLVNLMALLAGFVITPLVDDNQGIVWCLFFIFTFLHLFANYRAVSSVVMETVNLPRLHILLREYLRKGAVLSPEQVNKLDPVLRGAGYTSKIQIGCSFKEIINSEFVIEYTDYHIGTSLSKGVINVALRRGISSNDLLQSASYVILLDMLQNNKISSNELKKFDICPQDKDELHKTFKQNFLSFIDTFVKGLEREAWDLNTCHLGVDEWRIEQLDKNV